MTVAKSFYNSEEIKISLSMKNYAFPMKPMTIVIFHS